MPAFIPLLSHCSSLLASSSRRFAFAMPMFSKPSARALDLMKVVFVEVLMLLSYTAIAFNAFSPRRAAEEARRSAEICNGLLAIELSAEIAEICNGLLAIELSAEICNGLLAIELSTEIRRDLQWTIGDRTLRGDPQRFAMDYWRSNSPRRSKRVAMDYWRSNSPRRSQRVYFG